MKLSPSLVNAPPEKYRDLMKNWIAILLTLVSFGALAQHEDSYLDPAYGHPALTPQARFFESTVTPPPRSDSTALIARQSAVRSQGQRGTCSIFSAIGALESMMIISEMAPREIDLSEEWLQFLVNKNSSSDGSNSDRNFWAFRSYGSVEEPLFPYIGETWKTATDTPLATKRCGHLADSLLSSCLIVHRDPRLWTTPDETLLNPESPQYDPEFQSARHRSGEFRKSFLSKMGSSFRIYGSQAKHFLHAGFPVVVDADFFYGAWNHRRAPELGISRNMEHWNAGIVGYPEPGSLDYLKSPEDPAGHSIVLVGYDDTVVVTTQVPMKDGRIQEFRYQGVYYFKNSWGTSGFGNQFELQGQRFPGYGMITQKYMDEYGAFFVLPLQTRDAP